MKNLKLGFYVLNISIGILFLPQILQAKTVHYELVATRQPINLSGKKTVDFAVAINGTIPAPTLEFTEGDDAEIVVKNQIPGGEELSIHWHGILLPNEMDGVPYITTPPIFSGGSYTFRFKIRQSGTYWYHSHTDLQEQKGVFGAFIIHPKKKTIDYDKDLVVVLSDWSDETPDQILKNLKKDGDYYLAKKGTVRSWLGALKAGSLGGFLHNEWIRMGGMDLSDVGYDAFLVNGKKESQLLSSNPGEKIRLRIINAGASTYFNVSLGQTTMRVVSADGIDIQPTTTKNLLMGMAETYDVIFQIPENKNYELRATAQDGTGFASGWIGKGEKVSTTTMAIPSLYGTMDHSAHAGQDSTDHSTHTAMDSMAGMDHSKMAGMDHTAIDTLTVDSLKAQTPKALQGKSPLHEVTLKLGGDMSRYIWFMNGKSHHEDPILEIQKGDFVRFTFVNETMMHHPMHLHGHFFRVLNKNGEYSPLKHTVDVSPHSSRVMEFVADEPGQWLLHCHNLYHMKTGMGRTVVYSGFVPSAEVAPHQAHDPHLHDPWFYLGKLEGATNHAQGSLRMSNTWDQFEARVETRYPEYEGDLFYRRWFGQYFNLFAGGISFQKKEAAALGIGYKLPFLIESNFLVTHEGKARLDLEKRFQWTSAIFTDADFAWRPSQNADHAIEYEISLMYSPDWHWAAGLMLTDEKLGAGLQVQF